MSKKSKNVTTKQRVALVLDRLRAYVLNSEDPNNQVSDADCIAGELETVLTELGGQDFFGTEGQNDPRGDMRNGEWSMDRVEGLDK